MMINDIVERMPVHRWRKYSRRYISDVEAIAIHHSGGDGTPEAFARYHVSKGWPGIGYHYVIDKEANIFQTNRLDTISYNVGGNNTDVVGICIIGNYEVEELTDDQIESIIYLVKLIRMIIGKKPAKGHNEYKATLCPGKNIKELIKKLNE